MADKIKISTATLGFSTIKEAVFRHWDNDRFNWKWQYGC